MTFLTADQPTITAALTFARNTLGEMRDLRVNGKYALALEMKPEARPLIEAAVTYFDALAEEIGADTQLGCSGTPAVWAAEFRSELDLVIA